MFGSRSTPKDIRPSQVGCLFRRTPGKDFYQWIDSVKVTSTISLINNRMVTGVLGPGGIWGWVQGVGSDHWDTRSQP